LLEAFYFKKPVLVRQYSTYMEDIQPKGFICSEIDNFLTNNTVQEVQSILENPDKRMQIVNHNFALAQKHYGYDKLRNGLNSILSKFFGTDFAALTDNNTIRLHTHVPKQRTLDLKYG